MYRPKSTDVIDFPIYGIIKGEKLNHLFDAFLKTMEIICKQIGKDWKNVQYNTDTILNIIDLINRRRVYFHIFHNIEMGELNEACLRCFWILKLNPFTYNNNTGANINFVFAMGIFTRGVTSTAEKTNKKANFTEEIYRNLSHSFKYRDLSKEAIMAIAESLIS